MITRYKLRILARYLASECTEQEKSEVEEWVNASDKNRKFFDDFRATWELSGIESDQWSSQRALGKFRSKLKEVEPSHQLHRAGSFKLYRIIPHRTGQKGFPFNSVLKIAASLVLLVGTLYIVSYVKEMALREKNSQNKPVLALEEVSTRIGQQVTLKFSDGTKVLLNSASRLKYVNGSNGAREFYLQGEAYFDVVHSDKYPLVVQTDYAVIRDIGTKFDVKSWPDDDQTQVTVAEGKVFIQPQDRPKGERTIVSRGQYTIVNDDSMLVPPSYTNVEKRIAWIEGRLVFYNEPMKSVMKQLWRKYGLKCFVADPSILSMTITATFEKGESSKDVLDIIALSLNLTYKASNDSVLFVTTKPLLKWNKNKSRGGLNYEKGF